MPDQFFVLLTMLLVHAVLLPTLARPELLLAAQRFLALVQSGLLQTLQASTAAQETSMWSVSKLPEAQQQAEVLSPCR